MSYQILLITNSDVEPFLSPIPTLLNNAQSDFRFSLEHYPTHVSTTADVDETLNDIYKLKKHFKLRDEDLLIQFISAPLSSYSRGLANLFVACSSKTDSPPRVAAISTSFIRRHILPVDPTYVVQQNAFYHNMVGCLVGSYLDLDSHEDHGCLLDFNNYTPNIKRKLDAGYSFCNFCATKIEDHDLGRAVLDICAALKTRSMSFKFSQSNKKLKPQVFLCYAGNDRLKVVELFNRLRNDGFDPWMDKESILPGQDWELEIKSAVKKTDYFVACLSSHFGSRTYAHREIKLALDVLDQLPEGKIFLITARLEDCTVDARLSDRQWVDLFENDGYDKLLKSLRWQEQKN